jgi:hypothetical protein
MIEETKRLAKKYFNTDIEVKFTPCTMRGIPYKAQCSPILIQYNEELFSDNPRLMVLPNTYSTIVHEVCHLKWSHGDPEFRKNIFKIKSAEREQIKKFKEVFKSRL